MSVSWEKKEEAATVLKVVSCEKSFVVRQSFTLVASITSIPATLERLSLSKEANMKEYQLRDKRNL